MHPHSPFSIVEVLWTLTFAAQLVLLVVLLGRERTRRFPWFTASVIVIALRVLAARLLYNRLSQLTFSAILIALGDIGVLVGILLLIELSRKGFRGARRPASIIFAAVMLAVGGVVLRYWGPWPVWKTLTANSGLAVLLCMQLAAQKGELLVGILTIQLVLLMAFFGRRYGAGWRSHAQRILVGLSTVAISQFAVQAIWQLIAAHTKSTSQEQYERLIGVRDKMSNANSVVYIAVLIWWIYCLWKDEPGGEPAAVAPVPASQPGAIIAGSDSEPPAETSAPGVEPGTGGGA